MIPLFKEVTVQDKSIIERYTKEFRPYCDFNFSNIYNWSSDKNKTNYAVMNDNLIIKMKDFTTEKEIVTFIGKKNVASTVTALLNHYEELSMVPEECITSDIKDMEDVLIAEDIDNHDYVLSVTELCSLKGSLYKSKRKAVKKFYKSYSSHDVRVISLSDRDVQIAIVNLVKFWGINKNCSVDNELAAIKRFMDTAHLYELIVVGIYFENNLIAFTINELATKDIAIGSFGKADTRFSGIYSFLEHVTALYLFKCGVKYLNYEQDLGISTLRNAKNSWHPVIMMKKYKISRRN